MPIKIAVHDYSGHPFQFQLSQELSRRGHDVLHLYFAQFQTPQAIAGKVGKVNYAIEGLRIAGEFDKFSFFKRRRQEIEYGNVLARRIEEFAPDIVISSNAPLDAQSVLLDRCEAAGIPFVFWLQDIYSIAIKRVLARKIPVLGHAIGWHYIRLERSMLRRSNAVVAITQRFLDVLSAWGVPQDKCDVIENWAPTDEISPAARDNAWAREHGLQDKRVLLYSGTLGFKHNPEYFVQMSRHFQHRSDVAIVVISEGMGANWLKKRKQEFGLDNLLLLPFQPYDQLSDVLGTGDVLIAILEEDAGIFSVPSKVLSYLSAGKPILLSVPLDNLAADIVVNAGAGRAVAPRDAEGLLAAADELLSSSELCQSMGARARAYARTAFDIGRIGDRFESLFLVVDKEPVASAVPVHATT